MPKPAELYTHIHTQLRHCLAFLLFIIIPYNSFAIDACVKDDTVAIVLDPNISPSQYFPEDSGTSSDSSGTWNLTVNGIKLYGSSACVSDTKRFDVNGQLWDGDTLVQNEHSNGNNCYCRLIYPVVSKWVLKRRYLSDACNVWTCQGDCTPRKCKYECSWAVGYQSGWLRKPLFSSIK